MIHKNQLGEIELYGFTVVCFWFDHKWDINQKRNTCSNPCNPEGICNQNCTEPYECIFNQPEEEKKNDTM
jgi:hypothetical protein